MEAFAKQLGELQRVVQELAKNNSVVNGDGTGSQVGAGEASDRMNNPASGPRGEQASLLDSPLIELGEGECLLPANITQTPRAIEANIPEPRTLAEELAEERVLEQPGPPVSSEAKMAMWLRASIFSSTPEEILPLLQSHKLSTKGHMEVLVDRWTRFQIRKHVGPEWAVWDEEVDTAMPQRASRPEMNNDGIRERQSGEADSVSSESWTGEIGEPQSQGSADWLRRGGLPTGQSTGRFRDPISFDQGTCEAGSRSEQVAAYPERTAPRRSAVTFADAPVRVHQLHASTPTPEAVPRSNPSFHPSQPTFLSQGPSNPLVDLSKTCPSQTHNNPGRSDVLSQPLAPPPQTNPIGPQGQTLSNTELLATLSQPPGPRNPPSIQSHFTNYRDPGPAAYQPYPAISQPQGAPTTSQNTQADGYRPDLTHTIHNVGLQGAAASTPYPQAAWQFNPLSGGARFGLPMFASVGRSNLSAGFLPFEDGPENRATYSHKVSKCGSYLRSLNVNFNGKNGDADGFLMRIKDGAEMYGLTDEENITLLPYVLEGQALEWFRADRRNWRSYKEFVERFRLHYARLDSYTRVWEEIRERKQGEGETLASYVNSMMVLFARLEHPVPLPVQLDTVFYNLNPRYITALNRKSINSYQDFLTEGYEIEAKLRCIDIYAARKSPGMKMRQDMESPSRGRRGERIAGVEVPGDSRERGVQKPKAQKQPAKPEKKVQNAGTQTNPPAKTAIRCYYCDRVGHIARDCPKKRAQRGAGNESGSQ